MINDARRLATRSRLRNAVWWLACAAAASMPNHSQAACTALADARTGQLLKKEGVCDQRITPASTFKIAISLMGYDAGFLKNADAPALPFREGYPDWNPSWKTTVTPSSWMKNSVVWYSQQITQALGMARFARDVRAFGYGNEDVSGHPGQQDGLTEAWLNASLKISPREQLAFLGKVFRRELPVSPQAHDMTARITDLGMLPQGWRLHGKTGTGAPSRADGSADWDHAYGWFVGWAEKDGRAIVFVHQMQDERREARNAGLRARDAFLLTLPAALEAADKPPH